MTRRAPRKSELYRLIEQLLPFAEVEVDVVEHCLDMVPEGTPRAEAGRQAIERAKEVLAQRSKYMTKSK